MITKERFQQGMTWDEYLGRIQKNQDLFKTKYEEVGIGDAETSVPGSGKAKA